MGILIFLSNSGEIRNRSAIDLNWFSLRILLHEIARHQNGKTVVIGYLTGQVGRSLPLKK